MRGYRGSPKKANIVVTGARCTFVLTSTSAYASLGRQAGWPGDERATRRRSAEVTGTTAYFVLAEHEQVRNRHPSLNAATGVVDCSRRSIVNADLGAWLVAGLGRGTENTAR